MTRPSPARRSLCCPGRLAQLVRAPRLHRGGHWFEPSTAHHVSRAKRPSADIPTEGRSMRSASASGRCRQAALPPRTAHTSMVLRIGVTTATGPLRGRSRAWLLPVDSHIPGPPASPSRLSEQPGPGRVDLERVAVGERAWTGDVAGHNFSGLGGSSRWPRCDHSPSTRGCRRRAGGKTIDLAGSISTSSREIEVADLACCERQRVADHAGSFSSRARRSRVTGALRAIAAWTVRTRRMSTLPPRRARSPVRVGHRRTDRSSLRRDADHSMSTAVLREVTGSNPVPPTSR